MTFRPTRSFQRSKIVKDQDEYSNKPYNEGDNNFEKRAYHDNRDARQNDNSFVRSPYKPYSKDNGYREDRNFSQRPRRNHEDGYNSRNRDDAFVRDPMYNKRRDNFRPYSQDDQAFSRSNSPRYENSRQESSNYESRRNDDNFQRSDRNSFQRNSFQRNSGPRNSDSRRSFDEGRGERNSFDRYPRNDRNFDRNRRDYAPRENFVENNNANKDDFFAPHLNKKDDNFDKNYRNDYDSTLAKEHRNEREQNVRERSNRGFRDNDSRQGNGFRERSFRSDDRNDRFDRNDRNDRFDRNDRNDRFDRNDRNDRFDRSDRPQRSLRSDNGERNNRQRGRTSRFYENLVTLFDVDKELLNLLFRRAELLDGVKRDNRISPNLEKKLRLAWEGGTAKITKDPRIARDFFNLLQQLEPIPYAYSKPNYYSLAPQFTPVQIDLPGAPCSRQVRMLFALAAASGATTSFNTHLSPMLMSSIKAFNQLGGQLWWEGQDSVLSRGGSGVMPYLDKIVPVGSDELTFYLVLAMSLLVPARLKLVGDGALRFINTQAIKNFLPNLNARLTTVIPGQEGIPVRVESAGMMPNKIELTADLPSDFILALILTSCLRKEEGEIEFTLKEHSSKESIISELSSIFTLVQIPCRFDDDGEILTIKLTVAEPVFVENMDIEIDPMFASCLLAMPAFAGGKTMLRGRLNAKDLYCLDFLRSTGLSITCEEDCLTSEHPGKKLKTPDLSQAPSYPMALIFSILSALSGETVKLPEISDKFAENTQEDMVHGFLAQIGLKVDEENVLVKCEVETSAWFLPSGDWGLAASLLAFMRPNILLVNPELVTALYPVFWRVYNTLPIPTMEAAPKEEIEEKEEVKHRRVIASDILVEDFEEMEESELGELEEANGQNSANDFLFADEEASEVYEKSDELSDQENEEDSFFQVKHPDDEE